MVSKSSKKSLNKINQVCSLKTILIVVCTLVLIGILSKLIKSQTFCNKTSNNNEKIKFYYSKTCGFSHKQIELINDLNLTDHFNWVDCQEYPEKCKKIDAVPQFLTPSGKVIKGVQSGNQLINMINNNHNGDNLTNTKSKSKSNCMGH